MSEPTFEQLIEVKRDGRAHSAEEIDRIILGYSSGQVPDYQMSAWLMAAYLNGLDAEETVAMTDAMVRSGRVVDLSSIPGVKVDKHSTGGVADTTTLVLGPLVAACGVPVAKMSGRGLGHTGGTLDKLESIPGFRIELTPEEFVAQVRNVGLAVIAQSPDVDPADKLMYALRDVTATVPSIPLIVGSIISKKVAGGADAILLDVKLGSGAFMKTEDDARALAAEMTRVGRALGRDVRCVLSDMDQPLGMAVGNALEVREGIETLHGEGPEALTDLCLDLGARMLVLGRVAEDPKAARAMVTKALESGEALEAFARWIGAQGGDPRVTEEPGLLELSRESREVLSAKSGYLAAYDAEGVGRAAMLLGAGRERKDDEIDPGAGLLLDARVGDAIKEGDRLATLYAATEARLDAGEALLAASVSIGETAVAPGPLLREV
ncbi:MAG: thymidine phosphorylase [Coriobacteriia bacterium]|nr:thymidine phosphorylase [Coriobacteriia bacterium]